MRLRLRQQTTTPRHRLVRRQSVRSRAQAQAQVNQCLPAAISTAPPEDMTGVHLTLHSPRTLKVRLTAIALHLLIGTAIARLASKNTHRLAPRALDETRQLSFWDCTGVHGVDCMHRFHGLSEKHSMSGDSILYPWPESTL